MASAIALSTGGDHAGQAFPEIRWRVPIVAPGSFHARSDVPGIRKQFEAATDTFGPRKAAYRDLTSTITDDPNEERNRRSDGLENDDRNASSSAVEIERRGTAQGGDG